MTINRRAALACSTGFLALVSACAGAGSGPDATVVATDTNVPGTEPWAVTAAGHRGMDGQIVAFDCPPGGEAYAVWGSDVYTDDSSVCTAGVHAGAITFEEGGDVTIEIGPGEESYDATERNGVETRSYGPWGGSFIVVTD